MRSGSSIKRSFNLWGMLSAFFAALIILPNVNLFGNLFVQPNENWYHIKTYLLKEYITNTLVIMANHVSLTEPGRKLLAYAEEIIRTLEQAWG